MADNYWSPAIICSPEESNLGKHVIGKMCDKKAVGIHLQCGREYGFTDYTLKKRATDLPLLSQKELTGLPTNNLITERSLSVFDQ